MSSKIPLTREQKNKIVSMLRFIPDEPYLKLMYRVRMGKNLNLKNPQTFNEKLQWLKLHDRRPEYVKMVDKYEAKKYVASIIGEEYIIPTLGLWDSFDDIDFDSLPNQFVLKCTHDSGGLVICRDKSKLDIKAAKEKINASLKTNFYWVAREWPYKEVKPRIIAEKYMEDDNCKDLRDIKLMCFDGEVKCSFVCSERDESLKVTFFDNEWNRMPFERHYPASKAKIPIPKNFSKMKSLAEKLSEEVSFIRVDFFEINNQIFFGELTLYPGAGFEEFTPDIWKKKISDWISLTIKN